MPDGAGDEGKAQQEWVQGSQSFPADGLILQRGTPDHRERGFPCPRKHKAPRMLIQDAGCSRPLLPAPQSLSPAGDACTSLGGAGKP